ncbi:class E sortase [Microbacterium sp. ABRD28]|uniref:class E sortase n=1 Tax=Microbacterium sp. ABRD28 TaxID=2268461 RepID=UPI001F0CAAD0|nr:class E sortase [Microbacterium sp. ABRD28]
MSIADNHLTRRPGRVSVVGVVGEILITLGVVALLYVAWQTWIGDVIYSAQAREKGQALSEQWAQEYTDSTLMPSDASSSPSSPSSDGSSAPAPAVDPPVLAQPADAQTFATIRIPRFGPDYVHEVAGGTSRETTLDTARVGHYDDSEMPGQVGNFALAAHRTTFGALFNRIPSLKVGDAIVIETADGWYTYRFRNHQYVVPTQVDILLDVPQKPEVAANGRYLTMTSCSPIGSLAERIVGYSVFESYTPRSEGEPASLTPPTDS